MQPKAFICRMARLRNTLEPEGPSQVNPASKSTGLSLSGIATRMRVSAVSENPDPLVSLQAIASQMRLETVCEETSRGAPQETSQNVAAWERPESPSLSKTPSSLPEPFKTPTRSERMSPPEEEEAPRSLKRKRQPPRFSTTPPTSTRTSPAQSPSTVVTTPGSPDVARKIRSLRLDSASPIKDENRETLSRPRLRSETKKLKAESDNAEKSSQALQHDLATLRAQLEKEKRENAKLKAQANKIKNQANKDKDDINELRAEFNILRSEFASEKLASTNLEEELAALRADLDLFPYGVGAESGRDTSVNPETHEGLEKIIHMNEVLRRVIQGERIYNKKMRSELQCLEKKVDPLLAKVDGLQDTVEAMKAHFNAHDAPIELIMDFVRNFHQWWVDRYNARSEGGSTESTD